MESASRSRLYHVVCRDCPLERIFESADEADGFVSRHVAETDHSMAAERVD
ncbi:MULTISPECIES: hypothetical protein [Haloferacaceae]|uniref:Uncharacterized protein n=1 Tax=Halorubrum glutamatedens TaxID=2707018 RepID=A0ABD5QSA5_9EURY|nr:hypothetical protein [Halobellus captivus]